LFFPKGTYKVTPPSPADTDYLFGSGGLRANVEGQTWLLDQATLVYSGGNRENLITVSAPDVSIIGGTLDLSAVPPSLTDRTPLSHGIAVWSGQVATGVNYGPHGTGAAGAVIDGVTIKDAPGYAVFALNTNSVTVINCTLKDFFRIGVAVQNGISTSKADIHDFLIHGNRVESKWASFASCIYVGANDQDGTGFVEMNRRVTHARVTDNSCVLPREVHPGQGSFFQGGFEYGAIMAFNLTDCVFAGNNTEGGGYGITTGHMRRVVIANNTVRGFRGPGVEASGGHEFVAITGNIIDADGAGGPFNATTGVPDPSGTLNETIYGVLISGTFGSKNVTINDNTITGFTTPARAGAIALDNVCDGVTVSGNTISGAGGTSDFKGVYGNRSCMNLTVTGNTIDGANRSGGTGSTGVAIVGTTFTGVSITGNNFSNCSRAAFEAGGGTDFHFRGNLARNCFMVLRGALATPGGVTRFFHDVGLVKDANGNTSVEFAPVASAVNYLQFRNSPTLGDVAVRAMGTDVDVSLNHMTKGTGVVKANGTQVEVKGHTHTVAQVAGALSWTATVPGTPSAAGTQGHLAADSGFLYVCVTSGAAGAAVWKRLAFELWV
jgi:hypothetical protein